MANEIIDVIKRAEADMRKSGQLSRGTYFDILDLAIHGEDFATTMSVRDAYKLRALFTRRGLKGIMHQQMQENGTMRVRFNI